MALSSDNDANVAQVMEWFRSEGATPDALNLREELAYLLFYGDPTWANNEDSSSISDYRSILSDWLAADGSDESTFLQLTAPGEDSDSNRDIFTTWFTPVVEKWKQSAKDTESGDKGNENPNFDQTPGTEYYWYDPDNEEYLYASAPDAPDGEWLSYEARRYTPVAYDEVRETNYRLDVVTNLYEFHSKTADKWLYEEDWDREERPVAEPAQAEEVPAAEEIRLEEPVYDDGFEMWRRFDPATGQYEYAGDKDSENWLSLERATALRTAGVSVEEHDAATQAAYQEIIRPVLEEAQNSGNAAVAAILGLPGGQDRLRAEVMQLASEILAERS